MMVVLLLSPTNRRLDLSLGVTTYSLWSPAIIFITKGLVPNLGANSTASNMVLTWPDPSCATIISGSTSSLLLNYFEWKWVSQARVDSPNSIIFFGKEEVMKSATNKLLCFFTIFESFYNWSGLFLTCSCKLFDISRCVWISPPRKEDTDSSNSLTIISNCSIQSKNSDLSSVAESGF